MNAQFSRRVGLTSRALSGLLVGGAMGALLAVVLLTRMDAIRSGSPEPGRATSADPVQQAIDRHRCSTRGFGSERVPASALIKTAGGDLLLVSFDRGWKVHQDRQSAAELVAVCLDDPPAGPGPRRP
ncbi:MAG TPA: hypothetical protein VD864_12310 [Nocardioides sp.]|nr:hypothetical protein [Nocardioides sp.]